MGGGPAERGGVSALRSLCRYEVLKKRGFGSFRERPGYRGTIEFGSFRKTPRRGIRFFEPITLSVLRDDDDYHELRRGDNFKRREVDFPL